ncbi:MAG: phytoene/squalene synthase family protein [Cyclobacteriaceae bacterium]|jgi:phytoene/squalene synthetase|nr:phytoene/squalene synthase family protein [Cyclobacteriaceae bacterium]
MSKELFDKVSLKCSIITTQSYSTSFSLGIRCLDKSLRDPIYAIYGFVRFADEIVDTFHDYNKPDLFQRFKEETYLSIKEGISLNPILNSFQYTVNKYKFEHELIDQFLKSMEMDLTLTEYDQQGIEEYILGSAEVVGLMCLRVFCKGDEEMYQRLKPSAMKLGSAFQKINFLRDLNADFNGMSRTYFPGVDLTQFTEETKRKIEEDIAQDFKAGYEGILQLPKNARLGVYVAYLYYISLFKKIQKTSSQVVIQKRIRVPNSKKLSIFAYSFLKHRLNLL